MNEAKYAFFREALRRHPEAALELGNDTYRKYVSGNLPERVQWFLRHPDFLVTLAELARRSAQTQEALEPKE